MPNNSLADYIPGVGGAIVGGIQALIGGGQARRAQRQLEQMANTYKPNAGILDYYNKALQRYNVNPYTSQYYNQAQNQIKAGTAQGISALQDRRSVLGGLSSLIQGQNDALLKAGANAEGQQAGALSQLGQAAGLKAQEEFKPFEMKYNLLAAKAGGGNAIANAGLSNIFGATNNLSQMAMLKKLYGDQGVSSAGSGGNGSSYDYENSPYWKQRTRGL